MGGGGGWGGGHSPPLEDFVPPLSISNEILLKENVSAFVQQYV